MKEMVTLPATATTTATAATTTSLAAAPAGERVAGKPERSSGDREDSARRGQEPSGSRHHRLLFFLGGRLPPIADMDARVVDDVM
jgi:hypothetical protein